MADVEQEARELHPNDRVGGADERARRKAPAAAWWKEIEEMFPVRKVDPK